MRVARVRIEPRRRQPGEAWLGERGTVELEERRGNGVKPEGIAFLQNDAGKLAPDFDDEGFGHGWISLVRLTWSRSDESTRVEVVEAAPVRSKDLSCGINMARNFFI
jgi:hypothetical protein